MLHMMLHDAVRARLEGWCLAFWRAAAAATGSAGGR